MAASGFGFRVCPLPLIQACVTQLGSDSQDLMIACVSCLPVCLPNSNGRTAVITRPQRNGGVGGGENAQRLIVHKRAAALLVVNHQLLAPMSFPWIAVRRARPLHFHSSQLVPLDGRRHLWPVRHDTSQLELKTNTVSDVEMVSGLQ